MVEAPNNSVLLSHTEIGNAWVDTRREWVIGLIQVALIGLPLYLLSLVIGVKQPIIPFGILAFALSFWRFQRIQKANTQLDFISIASGHPWHHSDDIGDTTVYVLDQEKKWISLSTDARIVTTPDPLLERILLRNGDSEGEVLARCDMFPFAFSDLITTVNMAQALASAQNRDEGAEDEFEAAREREKSAESVLDREWLDTEEGTLEYEPGALLRAFKQSKNGEEKDSREL